LAVRGPLLLLLAWLPTSTALTGCSDEAPAQGFCAVPVADSPVRGPDDAPVTAVELADFQCPYCGRVVPTLEQVDAERPAQVRWVFKHLPAPYHPRAMPAAIAAECAHEQGYFWEMYRALYAHQDALSDADLAAYAADIGLDLASYQACLGSDPPRARIDADLAEADRAKVNATPTFFFNGQPLVGALPLEDFLVVVDRARQTAESSGLAPTDYYAGLEAQGCR
jgi:protein-disulfide isomerase